MRHFQFGTRKALLIRFRRASVSTKHIVKYRADLRSAMPNRSLNVGIEKKANSIWGILNSTSGPLCLSSLIQRFNLNSCSSLCNFCFWIFLGAKRHCDVLGSQHPRGFKLRELSHQEHVLTHLPTVMFCRRVSPQTLCI